MPWLMYYVPGAIREVDFFEMLRKHTLCKPVKENIPRLSPKPELPKLVVSSTALSYEDTIDRYAVLYPKKPVRLGEALELLSELSVVEGRDILAYPSSTYSYQGCDKYVNTVLAYMVPRGVTPGKVGIHEYVDPYITSVSKLVHTINTVLEKSDYAKLFIVSKYALEGNIHAFIKKLRGRRLDVIIATNITNSHRKTIYGKSVRFVWTSSHRKVVMLISYKNHEPKILAFRGSMNVFYPGVDDYLEASMTVREVQVSITSLFRALLIV